LTSPLNYLGRSVWPTGIRCETDIEMPRRRETEPKKLISFIKELRTLLPEQKALRRLATYSRQTSCILPSGSWAMPCAQFSCSNIFRMSSYEG